MTGQDILTGPVSDRPNDAGYPMTAAEARGIVAAMEREVPSKAKRKRMAAFYASNIAGKLSSDAIAVYQAYARS